MIELDPTLSHEEQTYVAHYVGYADRLLGNAEPHRETIEKRMLEIPTQDGEHNAAEMEKEAERKKEEDAA